MKTGYGSEGLTILVSGMVAGVPCQGGATWAVLQYVLGLRQLGHEVLLVEPVQSDPAYESGVSPSVARYFADVCRSFDLEGRAALLLPDRRTLGVPYAQVAATARRADLLLNLAGTLRDPELIEPIPIRLYVDLDPAFTQVWALEDGVDVALDGHTHFATVGLAVGLPGCDVPTLGREWIPTPPPVVLAEWSAHPPLEREALTTVANWRSYGSVEHDGHFYGQKAHALREYMGLPRKTDARFELALSIHPEEASDLEALRRNGWELVDPVAAAGTPSAYRQFVAGSWAELGITKSGYVRARSGWFSDRSVCYLSSGRPVIAQDTGFSQLLPTGAGLLAFSSETEAVAGIEAVSRDYRRHARAAREIAETHFRSEFVLSALLDRIGAGVQSQP